MVSLPKDVIRKTSKDADVENDSAGPYGTNGACLLVMGRDNSQHHMPPNKFIEHIILPFAAVLLILGANAAAWATVIRNRSLSQ